MGHETIQAEPAAAWDSRVRRLIAEIGVGVPVHGADDAHAALVTVTDGLLQRAAAVMGTIRAEGGPLDAAETLAARLLLSDLALVAAAWRGLGAAAAVRLQAAEADLKDARAILASVLDDRDD